MRRTAAPPLRRPAGDASSAALVGCSSAARRGAADRRAARRPARLRSASCVARRAARLAPAALAARRRTTTPAPRDAGFWGEIGYRIERAPARAASAAPRPSGRGWRSSSSAIEASPNGVLLLDASDQIEWCNSRAADHFGLDPAARPAPARHQPGPLAGVRRLPAGRQLRRAGHVRDPRGPGHAVGADPPLRRRARSWCCRRT